jgi:hypothetical protein
MGENGGFLLKRESLSTTVAPGIELDQIKRLTLNKRITGIYIFQKIPINLFLNKAGYSGYSCKGSFSFP